MNSTVTWESAELERVAQPDENGAAQLIQQHNQSEKSLYLDVFARCKAIADIKTPHH